LRFTKFERMKKCCLLFFGLTLLTFSSFAQKKQVVDKIVAVVGSNLILMSDIESEYRQFVTQGYPEGDETRCSVLEELLFQRLLINQAGLDSIEVTEPQIEGELEQRIQYFVRQLGSEQKLEEYYGKSINQIKDDFRGDIRKLLLARSMQGKITADIKVTPADVRAYFNSIPVDSLPFLNSEVEVGQIMKKPPISEQEKTRVKEKLNDLRERIIKGEDFATLAVLYSEDPGSAKDGGELGLLNRNELVPEFAAEAFTLKGKEVSKIVESPFGYHIIQLITRKGELINVRHILLTPKTSGADLYKAQSFCDSVLKLIKMDSISFTNAALKFSDDNESKNNGGIIPNPQTGSSKFETAELDQTLFFTIDKLKVGEISEPVIMQTPDGKKAYRLLYLKSRSEPHRANLKDDYQRVQNIALTLKQSKTIDTWIKNKLKTTFVKIDEAYKSCNFKHDWLLVNKPD
jgi:peptidyl-prolyl cis-trans isomerase SurA